jgi:hypothetical protein
MRRTARWNRTTRANCLGPSPTASRKRAAKTRWLYPLAATSLAMGGGASSAGASMAARAWAIAGCSSRARGNRAASAASRIASRSASERAAATRSA